MLISLEKYINHYLISAHFLTAQTYNRILNIFPYTFPYTFKYSWCRHAKGSWSTNPSCRRSPVTVVTEAFILLPHEGLLPYFPIILACDLVSPPFPGVEVSVECMTCTWLATGSYVWRSLPTQFEYTGSIWLIGNHTHSHPIWETIVHAIYTRLRLVQFF
jgi:hypothetical protein